MIGRQKHGELDDINMMNRQIKLGELDDKSMVN